MTQPNSMVGRMIGKGWRNFKKYFSEFGARRLSDNKQGTGSLKLLIKDQRGNVKCPNRSQ